MRQTRQQILIFCLMLFFTTTFAQQPSLVITTSHSDKIVSAEFSNDGKKIVTTSLDRMVKLWDVQSGNLLKETKLEQSFPEYAIFTADDKKVIIASNSIFTDPGNSPLNLSTVGKSKSEGFLFEWDIFSGKQPDFFSLHNYEGTKYMEIEPANQRLFILSSNTQSINIIDYKNRKPLSSISAIAVNSGNIQQLFNTVTNNPTAVLFSDVHFSPDGTRIISSIGKTLKIWNAVTGVLIKEIETTGTYLNLAQFDSSGKKIITGYHSGQNKLQIEIRNSETGKLLDTIQKSKGPFLKLEISPDWSYIGANSGVWSTRENMSSKGLGNPIQNIFFPTSIKSGKVRFSRDNKRFVLYNGTKIFVYDFRNKKYNSAFSGNITSANKLELSPDGSKMLVSSTGKGSEVWDLSTGKILLSLKENTSGKPPKFTEDSKYIITPGKTGSETYDISNGQRVADTRIDPGVINKNPAGRIIKTVFGDPKKIEIWDSATNILIREVALPFETTGATFTANENVIIAGQNAGYMKFEAINSQRIYLFDIQKNEIIRKIDSVSEVYYVSPDKKRLTVAKGNKDKSIGIIGLDLVTGKTLVYNNNIKLNMAGYQYYANTKYSGDGEKIAVTNADNQILLYDAITGKFLFELKDKEISKNFRFAENDIKDFSADGQFMKFYSKLQTDNPFNRVREKITVFNMQTGTVALVLSGNEGLINSVTTSTTGKIIAGQSDQSPASLYDGSTGKQYLLEQIDGTIQSSTFSKDNSLAYCLSNNIIRVYHTATGKLVRSFYCFNVNDYLTLLPKGYYSGSKKAFQSMYYVTGNLGIISFEQLDIKYNRPDLVLRNLGSTDSNLIIACRMAYHKRLKKLNIDSSAFNDNIIVPEADFSNRDQIDYEQTKEKLVLKITARGSSRLSRFNIWVNEVPVFGQRGISLRNRDRNDFDTTVTITLSQGENRIETSVTNINGIESYRIPLTVNYTAAVPQREMTRFIGIGIDKFADNKFNLQYCTKDIRDLAKKLKEKHGNDILIDTLFNEQVTSDNVKGLKQKLQHSTENDKIIIAYSGHGMLSKNFDYYLSTYIVNFDKPEQNGLPYDELENLLDSIPARKKLLLIDACHSGEVDKDELVRLNNTPDSLIKGLKPVAYKKEGQLGLRNSFELMKILFVDVNKSTGATVISAAAGTQFARERNDLKNGVFTYSIIEAMNKYPRMKISDLKKIVSERVEELTKGLQQPTSRNETIAVDWNLW